MTTHQNEVKAKLEAMRERYNNAGVRKDRDGFYEMGNLNPAGASQADVEPLLNAVHAVVIHNDLPGNEYLSSYQQGYEDALKDVREKIAKEMGR